MNLANEIVWRAVEASQRVRDEHAASVQDVAQRFAEHVGKPWKWRLESIRATIPEEASADGVTDEEGAT